MIDVEDNRVRWKKVNANFFTIYSRLCELFIVREYEC